jgi:phosphatidylglycerophosphatase A
MRRVADKVAWVLATWFGCGLFPVAPGTVGTLGAVPLYVLAMREGRWGVAGSAFAVFVVGVWAASVVSERRREKDPQVVVVDEVAGFLVTMLPVGVLSWRSIAIGFVLFRVLDVVKPWPARQLERMPSGWGIVLDDVAAGALGACVMAALRASHAIA